MRRQCFYQLVVFGEPRGPWRSDRQQANRDAMAVGMGSYDDWGRFYVTVPADIRYRHMMVAESVAA